jgi:hypothetical protein
VAKINIPEGGHEAVLRGENKEMVETWSALAVELDARVVEVFGENEGKSVSEVVPTLAYAHIAKAAYGMCSAADVAAADFDPAEFGERCAAIAREQMDRYRRDHQPKAAGHA